MGSTKTLFDKAWRDFVVDGVPSTGENWPDKAEIRACGEDVDNRLTAAEQRAVAEWGRSLPTPVQEILATPPLYAADASSGVSILAEQDVLWLVPVAGQSNADGDTATTASPGAAIATTPKYFGRALMPDQGVRVSSGVRSARLIDSVETTATVLGVQQTETICTAMLSSLVAQADAVTGSNLPRFASFVSAQGGMYLRQLKRGTTVWHRLMTAIEDVVAYAAETGMRVIVPGLCFIQGENESSGGYTRESYFAALRVVQRDFADDVQRMTGQAQRPLLFMSQTGAMATGDGLEQPVQLAQYDLGATDWGRLVGPMYNFTRTDLNNIHLTSIGQNRLGQLFARAIFAEMCGMGWRDLRPITVRVTSPTTIQIDYHVPVSPLVIDTTSDVTVTGLRGLYGFDVQLPDGSFATISAAAVSGNTSVILTLSSPLSAPWVRVAYAMRRNSSSSNDDGPILGARGCLRDSSSSASPWESYTLRNWGVAWSRVVDAYATDGAWTSYTPTVAWTGGTPTGATIVGAYKLVGKTLFLRFQLYSGSALNGATGVTVSLPSGLTAIAAHTQVLPAIDVGTLALVAFKIAGGGTVFSGSFGAAGGLTAARYYAATGTVEVQ